MPKITNQKVFEILQNPYFDHHAAMHLARERLIPPDGPPEKLFLPGPPCPECDMMIEAGKPGSGLEFLQMHHEMVRVFRFLLEKDNLQLLADWENGNWHQPQSRNGSYAPLLWDLDDDLALPHEIVGMLNVTDPEYLGLVFKGVKRRTGRDPDVQIDCAKLDGANGAIDNLGRFIERGVDQRANPKSPVDGSGFHNTLHEHLGSREGKAARGAEMNKLRNSMFNDYFWSLHLWIDGQYGRLLEKCGKPFETSGLDPAKLDMTSPSHNHQMEGGMMSMST